MRNKIAIKEAIERVKTTNLPVEDKALKSMITTLELLQELGFTYISKGEENE